MSYAHSIPAAPLPEPVPRRAEPTTRRGIALAMVLAAGAVAVVLAGVRSTLFDLERHTVPKELVLHATALACLLLLAPRWRRIETGAVGALLAAFIAWSALSALFASNHWLAFQTTGVGFSGLVVFAAASHAAREGAGTLVLAGIGLAAAAAAALGAAQAYGYDATWLTDSRPPGATFGNRNFLAHALAIATPVLLWLTVRARRFAGALPWLIGLALTTATVVLTRSRAAWLALAVAIAAMAIATLIGRGRALGDRARRLVVVGALAAAGAVAAIAIPNDLQWRSDSPYAETLTRLADFREGSGRGRLIQYRNTMRLVAADPLLGTGPGNWFVHYPLVTQAGDPSYAANDPIPTNPWPSSDWIAMIAERGPIGALLLVLAGLAASAIALRRVRADDPAIARRAVAAIGVLVATFVAGLFDAVLLLPAPTFLVWAALGALLPATAPVVSRPLEGSRLRLARAGAIAIALLLTLSAAGRLAAIRISGDGNDRGAVQRALRFDPGSHRLQLRLARRGGCSASLPHARAAARLMPFHEAPRRALARCGEGRGGG